MDYEKAYKEALERAKAGKPLDEVFPELKESEDERIRKSIINILGNNTDAHEEGWAVYANEIAWLKKQKDKRELDFAEGRVEGVKQTCQEIKDAMSLFEPKDLTPFELTFRDYIDSAIRYCLSGEGYQQYVKEWAADLLNLEKQKEQKPVSVFTFDDILALESAMNMAKHDNDSDLYNALQNIFERVHDIYHGEVSKHAEKLSREEYVKKFKVLCDAYEIKLPNREYDIYGLCDDLSKLSMDSGKQKPTNSEKPKEWSEEEKKHLYNAIEAVKYVYDVSEGTGGFKCVEFLKSLLSRPKSSDNLKPCEYTLSLVKKVADGEMLTCMEQMAIGTLYEDLKKL